MNLPHDWSFVAPWRLLLLLGVVALVAGYLWGQRRRSSYETRFTQVELLASLVPRRTVWRRHLPAGLLIATLALLTTAFARPVAAVEVPRDKATVILALDTSTSMLAEDIAPTRIAAAKAAAKSFVAQLPDTFAVGLVSFNYQATIVSTPTVDHDAVAASIDGLVLRGGTAIGDAVAASVRAADGVTPTAGQKAAPVTIVLLSDGISAGGLSVAEGAKQAVAAKYPVTTIAYGSDSPLVKIAGKMASLPVDATALADLADTTGGKAYRALSSEELKAIYADITARAGTKTEKHELSPALTGLGLLTALAASGASLVWFRVLP
ncbi:MAG: von Willebrand factor type [Frankiales bacterium]|nr:von Willebrand factor type [Frankiales bacterium]